MSGLRAPLSALLLAGAASGASVEAPLPDGLYAVWHTAHGAITARLHFQDTPLAVANFVGLAEGAIAFDAPGRAPGRPFYDGLAFHRIVPGFVVQGGDPLGTGEGGPGHAFADEFSPRLRHDAPGVLAMANAGPGTNGSQFYFTLSEARRLDYKHTVFGRVVRGLDVLALLRPGDVMERVEIVRAGPAAEAFRTDDASFRRLLGSTPPIPPRDPALSPLFHDAAGLDLPDWLPAWLEEKLHHYDVVRDVRIRVRAVPGFGAPPPESGTTNPLRHLHATLAGDDPRAATLVHVADEKAWRLWLADGLLPPLGVDPAALRDDAAPLHELKRRLLAPARAALLEPENAHARSVNAAITALMEKLDDAEASAAR